MADEVICTNGHITDPFVDVDTSTGLPVDRARGYVSPTSVERGSPAWTRVCRAEVRKGGQHSPHQCRAACYPLANYPELDAAYRLGGGVAVAAILKETRGFRPD